MGRALVPTAAAAMLAGAMLWAVSFATLPQADFTFCNETEIKTVDPAIVTGQPEGRIVSSLYEGLTRWDPKDLHPIPGVAERWEISPDQLTYRFYLRNDALWSDGTPVTADDFVWSFRRFLHPGTGAEYAYQLWYVKRGRDFSTSQLAPGDPVEIELLEQPAGALPHAAGRLLHGKLLSIESPAPPAGDDAASAPATYRVEIEGAERRFRKGGGAGTEDCRWVLLDFDAVGIHAEGPRVVRIELEHPTPYFLSLMGFYPLSPLNRRCIETHGYPAWTKPGNLVNNGPYLLEFRRIRDRIRLVKNPHYWNRDEVHFRTVDALAVTSAATAVNLYLTGEADWVPQVPTTIVPELLRQKRPDFNPQPYLGIYYYRVNTTRAPLNDVRVRRALALAINRRAVVDTVTRAGQIPAYSFVPPGIAGYTQAECPHENLDESRRLLAEAGFPDGRGFPPTFEILFNDLESHKAIAELIQDQWKRELGIGVRAQKLEWAAYLARTRQLDYWVSRAAWIGDYPDPNTFLDMFVTDGPNNQTGWSNAEYDRLLALAATQADPAERMATLHAAERILMDELPVLPVYYYVTIHIVRPYLRGFFENVQDVHPLVGMWIDPEARAKYWQEHSIR
ncbi:MAG: peptide ABC transporter substrate-binding protein [Pirellulales bacterium]|nr:peptide ABC transporter substrate-binding protein [Pirellulales bacterium]